MKYADVVPPVPPNPSPDCVKTLRCRSRPVAVHRPPSLEPRLPKEHFLFSCRPHAHPADRHASAEGRYQPRHLYEVQHPPEIVSQHRQ
jgi:hypothetical protein